MVTKLILYCTFFWSNNEDVLELSECLLHINLVFEIKNYTDFELTQMFQLVFLYISKWFRHNSDQHVHEDEDDEEACQNEHDPSNI